MKKETALLEFLSVGEVVTEKDYCELVQKGYATFTNGEYTITKEGLSFLKGGKKIAWDYTKLADRMKELTPRGRKGGIAWQDSTALTSKRIKRFTELFPDVEQTYTEDNVIDAYKNYINYVINHYGSENSQYRFALKYFIFKDEQNDFKSELLNRLEELKLEDKDKVEDNEYESGIQAESWTDNLS